MNRKTYIMKKKPYIYSLLLFCFCSSIFAQEVQNDSIPKLDGILKMKEAETDPKTGEQIYYTVVEVSLPEGLSIEQISASTTIKVGDKWQEKFTFYEPESIESSELMKFFIRQNTLHFELGLYPEKYKVKVLLYDVDANPYRVKLVKSKHKMK